MRPKPLTNYLSGYPSSLTTSVQQLINGNQLANILLNKYPQAHQVRTDRVLYDYVRDIKTQHLRNTGHLSKVVFDNKLQILKNALGTHTTVSRIQGANLKTKSEIRVAGIFKEMPVDFLRMIVVHELAHLKECDHGKAFYQLCLNMEPNYHQLEFDLRIYLTYLDLGGRELWTQRIKALGKPY